MKQGISIRAYARQRGCADNAVRKAIKTKRITTNADGTIDPERANREWAANTFAGAALYTGRPAPAVQRGAQQDDSIDPVTAYLRARAITESYKAKVAQLEYEERAGRLIQASKAGEYAMQFSSIVGDALAAWPDRLAPLVAASTDEGVAHRILNHEVAALRRKIAKAITDAGL